MYLCLDFVKEIYCEEEISDFADGRGIDLFV
jgi:hypothetical protein